MCRPNREIVSFSFDTVKVIHEKLLDQLGSGK